MTISATGQAGEEFWWSNVPEKDKNIFNTEAGPLPGLSSYREVQVRIDNQLAGLVQPFPVVFTGGIAPPLHRPVVGLQAFDLREHEIDISPFLGLLCDGKEHTFRLDVVGVDDSNGTDTLVPVPMHWALTGKLFLWLDEQGAQTIGSAPNISMPEFDYSAESIMEDGTVFIRQSVKRSLHAVASVTTQQGSKLRAWRQSISMGSDSALSNVGDTQYVRGRYEQTDLSSVDQAVAFTTNTSYPIHSDSTYQAPDGDYDFSIRAALLSAMTINLIGQHVFPVGLEPFIQSGGESWNETTIDTLRLGAAFFYSKNGGNSSGGSGNTNQSYSLTSTKPLYMRYVSVINETTVQDREFVLKGRQSPDIVVDANDSGAARQSNMDGSSPWPNLVHKKLSIWPER